MQLAVGGQRQQLGAEGLQAGLGGAACGEQLLQLAAQGAAGVGAEGEEGVEVFAGGDAGGFGGLTVEQAGGAGDLQVEDVRADGDAATRGAAGRAEDAQRQVLQGKSGWPLADSIQLVRVSCEVIDQILPLSKVLAMPSQQAS